MVVWAIGHLPWCSALGRNNEDLRVPEREKPADVASRIHERCGDILDRIVCSMELDDVDQQREFVQSLKSAGR